MKPKKKEAIFICQFIENTLKVIKCLLNNNIEREFMGLEIEKIPSGIDDKKLTEKISQIFNKLGYNHNPIIISLPRSSATYRYLKVPTQVPSEIERIVSLQAARYLPYSADELITGYQVISTDKEGYSDINLVIVHKDVVERYVRIFKELKTTRLTIALSSYGLGKFYDYLRPEESGAVMIIDIDSSQIELVIIANKRLLFSRYFKFDKTLANWEDLLINEINKTCDAYLKEVSQEAVRKIVVMGAIKTCQDFTQALDKKIDLPLEVLSCEKINLSGDLLNRISTSDNSFVSLIGLALREIQESLNLVPWDMKELAKRTTQRKEYLRLILLISSLVLLLGWGITNNLHNKAGYLRQLKIELKKIEQEARSLEELEERFKFLENRLSKKPSSLDILYEIHQTIPNSISLINFIYEEDNQVVLHGQTPQLDSVFTFVEQLEKSKVFKNFNVKVGYATKKKTQTAETVDFEVVCLKK